MTFPFDVSTVHSPLPLSVMDVCVQFGEVSPVPHKSRLEFERLVPVSLVSGVKVASSPIDVLAVSALPTGAVGELIVALMTASNS